MEHLETHRSFVSYIDRSREYYAAQGYPKAYAWPRYDEVPFTPLEKAPYQMPGRIGNHRGQTTSQGENRRPGVWIGSTGVVRGTDKSSTNPSIHG